MTKNQQILTNERDIAHMKGPPVRKLPNACYDSKEVLAIKEEDSQLVKKKRPKKTKS